MAALGSLVVQLGLNYAQFTAGLSKSESDALAAAKRIQDTVDGVQRKAAEIAGTIVGGIAAGLTINAFKGIISGTIESAAAMHDLAIQTGSTSEALSGLAAIGKYSDQSASSIADAMGKLTKNMAGATEESKGAGLALQAIGINFDQFRKLSPDQQFVSIAKALDGFEDSSAKAAVAQALLGKEGAKMLPFLKDLAVAGDLQVKLTTAQTNAADNLSDNWLRVSTSGDAWKKQLALGMIPTLDLALQSVLDVTNGSGGLRAEVKKLSDDGSIKAWTEGTIKAFAYVIDVGAGLIGLLRIVAASVKGLLDVNIETFSALGDAATKAAHGDFQGAWNTIKGGAKGVADVITTLGTDVSTIFNQKGPGTAYLDAFQKRIDGVGDAAEKAKPKIDYHAPLDKNKKSATDNAAANDLLAASIAKLQGADKLQVNDTKQTVADISSARKRGSISDIDAIDATADAEIASLNASKINLQQQLTIYGTKKNGAKDVAATQAKIDEQDQAIANRERQRNRDIGDSLNALDVERDKQLDGRIKDTDALANQLYALQQEGQTIGLTAAQVRSITIARAEEVAVRKEALALAQPATAAGDAEADQLREQARLIREIAQQTSKNDIAKEATSNWKSFTDSLYNGLTDSLFRAFENGGKFFSTLWAGIKNTFKTTVLKLAIQGVLSLAGAGLSAAVGAATGSGGLSVGDIAGSASLANQLATGTGAIGAIAGNFGFGASTGLGLTLSGNTGAALNLAYGNLIGEGGAGAAAGAGTAFGAIAPYAAAAAILYEAFKSGSRVNTNSGYNLGFSGKDLGAAGFDISKVVGGGFLTGGDKERTDYFKLPDAIQTQFQKTASDFTGQLSGLLAGVGVDFNKQISGFVEKAFDLGVGGLSAEDAAKVVANYFGEVQERMAQYILGDGAGGFGKAGETAVQTIARLSQSLQAVNPVLALLGQRVLDVSLKGGDAASQLIDLVGGLDNFNNATKDYYQNYYSDAERAANSTEAVRATLAAVGVQMPATREQFRKLVEAQDLTTTSGRAAEAALLGVEGVFADLVPAAVSAADALAALHKTQVDAVQGVFDTLGRSIAAQKAQLDVDYQKAVDTTQSAIDGLNVSVDHLTALSDRLKSNLGSFATNAVTGMSQQEASAQVAAALAIAKASGQLPDVASLDSALTVLAQPTTSTARSLVEYVQQQDEQISLVAQLNGLTGDQIDQASMELKLQQKMLDKLGTDHDAETARLDGILTAAQLQVDALNGVNTSVLSVVSALDNFNAYVLAAGGAGKVTPGGGTVSNGGATATGIAGIFQSELGRAPTAADYNYYSGLLNNGTGLTLSDISRIVGESSEAGAYASLPHFAGGGYHAGGLAIVGENGPEVADFGSPARIYSASRSRSLFNATDDGGDWMQALVAEVQQLRAEVASWRAERNLQMADEAPAKATALRQLKEINRKTPDLEEA